MQTLFVTGAGFSSNAGLPLASEFGTQLLNIRGMKLTGPNALLTDFLRCFVRDIFGLPQDAPASAWPPLEDIFTFVDLSANSGHHLGKHWSPSRLRAVRRALIARSMRMLQMNFNQRAKAPDLAFNRLTEFVKGVRLKETGFLSLNWDAALEQRFRTLGKIDTINYGCRAISAHFGGRDEGLLEEVSRPTDSSLTIFKPHGSFNWTYCDTCRNTFWVPPHQIPKVSHQIFRESDWAILKAVTKQRLSYDPPPAAACPRCESASLGTRLGTFSYRKALEFPMHVASWRSAEEALFSAENWVFVGYSLPAADYELKLLLKRVQLARPTPPKMFLITKGRQALPNYKSLFGSNSFPGARVKTGGLDTAAIAMLRREGVLD